MAKLIETVRPRRDVLEGELTEARFAASLEEVVAGTAPDAYRDAAAFFDGTYPSGGLRQLLNEALGRLGGGRPDGASVIRLETSLGGGKTHNLIALYHAAGGYLDPRRAGEFMDVSLLPPAPVPQVGVYVGTSSGAQTFPEVAGVHAKTIWGYLALQLGGTEGYELVRTDDVALTAPGSDALKRLLGGQPSLVLIDEIARYYAVAKGVRVAQSTLASQTTAFLQALMEAVDALPRAVLVITTTGTTDTFGEDTQAVLEAIGEARSLMARKELVLQPSEEADLPRILARRLFESIPEGSAGPVAQAYADAADTAYGAGLDLPVSMTGAGWASEVRRHYPFHPSLIRVLDKRLSTIPNFQRTRGALRLLARVVRRMWEQRSDAQLIHLHHVDLAEGGVAEDLSSRLDRPAYEPVIRADIASRAGGAASHAEEVDARMGTGYARRLAATIYLYSLTLDVPGVPAAEIFGATLAPGDDVNLLQKALTALEDSCWYLHADVRGFRFSTEASLVKLVQEATEQVSFSRARTQATKILGDQFRDGALKVRRAWEDAKVPDTSDDAWLVVLDWDEFGDAHGVDPHGAAPRKVLELWEKTPTGGLREFRNRLVILAPSQGSHEAMLRTVRQHLGLEALASSADTHAALGAEKWTELRERAKQSALEARVAVCNHVNILYVPTARGLEPIELDQVTTASVRPNQTDAILDRLAAMDKTLAAGDKPLDPGYVKVKLGEILNAPLATNELLRAFARRTDLKMVLDRSLIVALVQAGVRAGVWEYQDPERGAEGWATRDRPTTVSVRLAEDTFIHPPGSAPPVKVVNEVCPFCGTSHPGRPCPDVVPPRRGIFSASGAAGKAFVDARAAAAEAGRTHLHALTVTVDHVGAGAGQELARLHTLVNSATLGVSLRYQVDLTVTLTDPADTLKILFKGTPADYAPLRDAVRQILQSRQAVLKASVHATFADPPDLSGDQVQGLAQVATDTGPTRCTVTVTTESDT